MPTTWGHSSSGCLWISPLTPEGGPEVLSVVSLDPCAGLCNTVEPAEGLWMLPQLSLWTLPGPLLVRFGIWGVSVLRVVSSCCSLVVERVKAQKLIWNPKNSIICVGVRRDFFILTISPKASNSLQINGAIAASCSLLACMNSMSSRYIIIRRPICLRNPTTGFRSLVKTCGAAERPKGDTETCNISPPKWIGGRVDCLGELESGGMHPSDIASSSNPLVGWDLGGGMPLHLEVFHPDKLIQAYKVDYRVVPSPFLLDQKDMGDKTAWAWCGLHYSPFIRSSFTSCDTIAWFSFDNWIGGGCNIVRGKILVGEKIGKFGELWTICQFFCQLFPF